jgi:hypothetical protein
LQRGGAGKLNSGGTRINDREISVFSSRSFMWSSSDGVTLNRSWKSSLSGTARFPTVRVHFVSVPLA